MNTFDAGIDAGRRAAWRALLGLGLSAGLAACGNKGPLYLPDQDPLPKKPRRETDPKPATSEKP